MAEFDDVFGKREGLDHEDAVAAATDGADDSDESSRPPSPEKPPRPDPDPERALTLKKEGNDLYSNGENDAAVKKYTEALDYCPDSQTDDRAILFANRAAAKIKMGLNENAIEDCSTAIELKPNYVKALLRRAHTYEKLDKPHEAMKDFQSVLENDPSNSEANIAVARLPERIREKDEELKKDMMENLKKLGNMVLKPFGLSTNNFQFVQDPNSGGYSVNFKQNGESS